MANWNNDTCGNCKFKLPAENPISNVLPIVTCVICGTQGCPKCNPTPSRVCPKCAFDAASRRPRPDPR